MGIDDLIEEVGEVSDEDLELMTPAQRAEYVAHAEHCGELYTHEIEDSPYDWLDLLFPAYFPTEFAAHHKQFWDWLWEIELGVKPDDAFIALWPRGGAKSTSAEAGVVSLGARKRRKYVLYICETQPQADDHVGNIGTMIESQRIGLAYPELGQRLVGKFGSSKGWRRNRLRTRDGFTVDALGLDVAARGLKLDEDRPDLFVFDDLDSDTDGPGQIEKKIDAITKKLLPAGSDDLAILGIQNLVHPQGVFARLAGLASDDAEFLTNRIVSGPIPALYDATFDQRPDGGWTIVSGRPAWEGQDLERCQQNVDDWGITAFKAEAQHDTDARGGGMFDHIVFQHCAREDVPPLIRTEVWVDPAVTSTDNSDSMAIQCDGLGVDKTIYRLRSWEERATPVDALKLAIAWAMLEGAMRVGVETDQGGDTWRSVYKEAIGLVLADVARLREGDGGVEGGTEYVQAVVQLSGRDPDLHAPDPFFAEEKAGSTQMPKAHRIQQMSVDYEKAGRVVHVLGTHLILERALFRFPARKPFDLADAAFWGWRAMRMWGQPTTSSGRKMAAAAKSGAFPKIKPGTFAPTRRATVR